MESENLPFPPHWIFLPVTLIYQTQIKKVSYFLKKLSDN